MTLFLDSLAYAFVAPRLNRVVTVVFCRTPKFSSFWFGAHLDVICCFGEFLGFVVLVVVFVEFLVLSLVSLRVRALALWSLVFCFCLLSLTSSRLS